MSNFTVDEKMKIVILGFDPKANIDGICKKYGITQAEFREWKDLFLRGAKTALSKRSRDTQEIRRNLEQTREELTRFLRRGE